MQMNRHSTLVSYLHKLLVLLTGNFGKKGAGYRPSSLVAASRRRRQSAARRPVTGAKIIGGLTPCNVMPEEILTDHPKRFRAMLVESGNPAHSLADRVRMREALAALELVVVIDVAFTETARLAHYVLPVASQFEKAEATFFNFEFPHNYFHLRKALMPPLPGLFSEAELHARLVEALGALPHDAIEALRAAWLDSRAAFRAKFFEHRREPAAGRGRAGRCSIARSATCCRRDSPRARRLVRSARSAAPRIEASLARAGFTGSPPEAADALFDALLGSKSAVVFAVDDWEESFARVRTPNGRIQLAIPELFDELDGLASRNRRRRTPSSRSCCPLASGARSPPTRSSATRTGAERTVTARCACIRTTRSGSACSTADACASRPGAAARRSPSRSPTACSPDTSSLPNGLGLDFPDANGKRVATGVAPNELTRGEDRDWIAGTPWHKHTPARVEAL